MPPEVQPQEAPVDQTADAGGATGADTAAPAASVDANQAAPADGTPAPADAPAADASAAPAASAPAADTAQEAQAAAQQVALDAAAAQKVIDDAAAQKVLDDQAAADQQKVADQATADAAAAAVQAAQTPAAPAATPVVPVTPADPAPDATPAPATPDASAGAVGTVVSDTAAPVVAEPAPVSATPIVKGLIHQPTSVDASTKVDPLVPEWVAGLGTHAQTLYGAFEQYLVDMRPRAPITDAAVARNQAGLAKIFNSTIVALAGNDFNKVFGHILSSFHKHRDGALHEMRVNRGADNVPLSDQERRLFQRLCNLFHLAADPVGRAQALKQVDLDKTLQGVPESGRQKVFGFFNL